MDADAIQRLSDPAFRSKLPRLMAERIDDASVTGVIETELAELLGSWNEADWESIREAATNVGTEQRLYVAHPELRRAARLWCRRVLAESTLDGAEELARAAAEGPTVIVCNHRSYIDSSAMDFILCSHGREELADCLVSAAGPKVYEGFFRRLVSASLSTIPVPQSSSLGHTARLPARELARQSLAAVACAQEAMREGRLLLIFPEGARSRTGRMQPFLPAVYRYLKLSGSRVVPAALTGTAEVMGVGARGAQPRPCALRFGAPIEVEKAGGARHALAEAEAKLRELLPTELKQERA